MTVGASGMADAFSGESDRSGAVVGETPVQSFVRMRAPSRRVERAYGEARTALDNIRMAAENIAEQWRVAVRDAAAVRAAEEATAFFSSLEAELRQPVAITEPGDNQEPIQGMFGYLLPPHALDELTDALQARAGTLSSPVQSDEVVLDQLASAPHDIGTWKEKYYPAALDGLTDIQAHGYTVDVGTGSIATVLSKRQAHRVAMGVQAVEAAAGQAKAATGEAGTDVIGATFKTTATDEAKQAKRWTWAVFALVLLGAATTLTLVVAENDLLASVSTGWALVFKALVGLPLYGLAAYCAGVAGGHRALARHFLILSVQLRSVGAYVEPMSDEQRSELRMILGRQAFSTPASADTSSPRLNPGTAELTTLLGRALDIAKGDKGN